MSKIKKTKKTIEEMVKLFDAMWAKDPLNALPVLTEWPGICKEHGWTSEEFDDELDKWQKDQIKKSA